MKKELIFKSIFIIILIIFWGCDVVPEPEPVRPDPVVVTQAYATPTSVAYGDSTTLTWNFVGVSNLALDGNPISNQGSKTITLTSTATFIFSYSYEFKSTTRNEEKVVVVPVGDEPIIIAPTIFDTLSSFYWVFVKNTSLLENNEWGTFYFDEDMRTRKWFLYKDKTYEKFKKDGTLVGNGSYDINKDTLIFNNGDEKLIFEILVSDSTSMYLHNLDSTSVNLYDGYLLK